jgi:Kef-type K+ transport system membrane component KefB
MTEKIEDLVSILFVPLYFAYAGLNIQLGNLGDWQSWGFVLLVVGIACGGTPLSR